LIAGQLSSEQIDSYWRAFFPFSLNEVIHEFCRDFEDKINPEFHIHCNLSQHQRRVLNRNYFLNSLYQFSENFSMGPLTSGLQILTFG